MTLPPAISLLLLAALTVHTSGSSFILHFCKAGGANHFTPSNVVLVSEFFKLVVSLFFAYLAMDSRRQSAKDLDDLEQSPLLYEKSRTYLPSPLRESSRYPSKIEMLKRRLVNSQAFLLAIPAALYVVQNNLRIFAASRLDPATFQVLSELKLISTAVASTLILQKRLNRAQWCSILLLMAGVIVVQSQGGNHQIAAKTNVPLTQVVENGRQMPHITINSRSNSSNNGTSNNHVLGLLAMLAACTTSGVAGVYLEKLVERGELWSMNSQLSFWSLIPASFPTLYASFFSLHPSSIHSPLNPFHGFNRIAWLSVLSQVTGGLIVSLVIKYCGNIHKNFSQGAAIILSYVAGLFFLGGHISARYIVGCWFVVMGTAMYNLSPAPKSIKLEEELQDSSFHHTHRR